jgi:threonyl-tRNA synthetase
MPLFTLPDGKVLSFDKPVSGREVAQAIGPGLAKKAIAVKLDGNEIRDLDRIIDHDAKISIITASNDNPDALHVLRHSAAHVLAEAVCSLYPKTRLAYGPAIEDGFFYDMQIRNAADEPVALTDAQFAAIEAKMAEIVKANRPFTRTTTPARSASRVPRTTSTSRTTPSARSPRAARPSRSIRPARRARRGRISAPVPTFPAPACSAPARS